MFPLGLSAVTHKIIQGNAVEYNVNAALSPEGNSTNLTAFPWIIHIGSGLTAAFIIHILQPFEVISISLQR